LHVSVVCFIYIFSGYYMNAETTCVEGFLLSADGK